MASYPTDTQIDEAFPDNNTGEIGADDMRDFQKSITAAGKDYSAMTENVPTTFPPTPHSHAIDDVTGLQDAIDAKADIASPAFSGTPTAPNPSPGSNTAQIATAAFVQSEMATGGNGDMLKSVYDPNDDGKVNSAENADAVPYAGISGLPSSFPPDAHTHPITEIQDNQTLARTNYSGGVTLEVVTSMPGTPDANTIYFVVASLP